jgi:cell division protein FtsL
MAGIGKRKNKPEKESGMTAWSTVWKQTTVLFLVLAGGLALVLFSVKYKVQDLEDELNALNREIAREHRNVHVLSAEFSHLVEARRLRRLATEHLHMEPIQPDQLGTFASLRGDPHPAEGVEPSVQNPIPGVPAPPTPTTTTTTATTAAAKEVRHD